MNYANTVYQKCYILKNCVGFFIDGTVIGVASRTGYDDLIVAYNGPKRKNALNVKAINSPDGLILHTDRSKVESMNRRCTF